MALPDFKIRCSAIADIMSEPKSKEDKEKGLLSETGKTYCENWLKEQLYNRRPELKSKYLDKGNEMEESGFTLICLELNLGMVYKNTELLENGSMKGTPDLRQPILVDNKCSWDLSTFPMFDTKIPDMRYWWQLQGYMALDGQSEAKLCYTLINTPEHLIHDEIRRKLWKDNQMDMSDNDKYNIFARYVFDLKTFDIMRSAHFPMADLNSFVEIPQSKRIKTFDIKRDDTAIAKIYSQVQKCRNYIKTII